MRKYTIILVENDEDEFEFMREGFEAADLFTILAQVRNGDQLLDWLVKHPDNLPDLVLSDLNMPGKNGYDVLVEMKNNPQWSQIPVLITSTSSTKTMMEKCLALGAADYIVKPESFIEYAPYAKNLHRRIEEKQLVK